MAKPKIRFKGYTDDWEQRKLGDLVGIYDGVHQTPDYQDSGIMFLSVENIATLKSEKYISEEAFERDYNVYPEKGDILMTRIGDVGTTNVVETAEKVAFYVSLALLKPNGIDSYFLSNAMKTNDFQKGLRERTLVTAIPQKINKDEIGKINIFITNNDEEQKKIGAYFSSLDHLITLHQRKCEETKKLKKYMLQKMFPQNGQTVPEIRFAGFTDAWEQRKLGEYVEITSGEAPAKFQEGDINYVKVDDLNYAYKTVINTQNKVLKNSSVKMVQAGSVIFPKRGAAILTNKVRVLGVDSYMDTNMMALSSEKLDTNFLYIMLSKEGLYKIADTSTIPQINNKHIEPYKIYLPSMDEQLKIGIYFSNLDNLITLHQRKQNGRNLK